MTTDSVSDRGIFARAWYSRVLHLASLGKKSPLWKGVEFVRDARSHAQGMTRGTFAQHGEDRFVFEYFKGKSGIYVDIGAGHPFTLSNTYLLYRSGWRGITVEPILTLHRLHQKWRPDDIHVNGVAGDNAGRQAFFELVPSVLSTIDEKLAQSLIASGEAVLHARREVEVFCVRDLCERYANGQAIDLLTIDAEGAELSILAGCEFGERGPKVVICELQQFCQSLDWQRVEFLQSRGYRLIKSLGCNGIFEQR